MNLKDPKTKFLLEVIKSRKYDKYTRKIATEVIASKNNMEVKDVEDYIANNPGLIGKGLKLSERQLLIERGRIDLLFEDSRGNLIVVGCKNEFTSC